MFVYVFSSLLSFIVTFVVIQFYRSFALSFGIIDFPNERSNHRHPMPRGAGICFYLGFVISLVILYFMGAISLNLTYPIFLGGSMVMLLGYWDDLKSLSASIRLFVQLLSSIFVVTLMTNGFSQDIDIPFLPNWQWLSILFSILYVSWFVNLYNFMDGSDGLATLVGIVGSMMIAAISFYFNNHDVAMIYSCLGFSLLAFLTLNWHPAELFMGDAGAYFLGYIFGAFALLSKIVYGVSLYIHLIVFGMFVVDATWTLLVRFYRGERVSMPHKLHAFQKLIAAGWSHPQVAFLYAGVMVAWLLPLAIMTTVFVEHSFWILVVAYLPIYAFVIWVGAGTNRFFLEKMAEKGTAC